MIPLVLKFPDCKVMRMIERSGHDEGQLPADNRRALRLVVRGRRKASLATLMGGAPYCSLVTVAVERDLSVLLLLSGLSDHTRNIQADARVSLLFDATDGLANPQTGPRVTMIGTASRTEDRDARDRFLAIHPGARLYAGFGDFAVWRVAPDRAHFVGGFGRAVWFDHPFGMRGGQLNLGAEMALPEGVVGIDCDGIDIWKDESFQRLDFPRAAETQDSIEALISQSPGSQRE